MNGIAINERQKIEARACADASLLIGCVAAGKFIAPILPAYRTGAEFCQKQASSQFNDVPVTKFN
jgi:hypothetical protein